MMCVCHRSDDQLHDTARKIITALIARMHTVEWSTAIVQHPAGRASQVRDVSGFAACLITHCPAAVRACCGTPVHGVM